MYAAYGAVAALYERGRTGTWEGRAHVPARGHRRYARVPGDEVDDRGQVPVATGNHHPAISPYGLYHTADGPVQVACGSEALWRTFAPLVDVDADDQRFATNRLRVVNRNALTAEIEKAFRRHDAAYWLARLDEVGIPRRQDPRAG
jgi:crotonobetainyl-CoA:carnitine CoA-transferase CaiB-like acyl-CoA transferase